MYRNFGYEWKNTFKTAISLYWTILPTDSDMFTFTGKTKIIIPIRTIHTGVLANSEETTGSQTSAPIHVICLSTNTSGRITDFQRRSEV